MAITYRYHLNIGLKAFDFWLTKVGVNNKFYYKNEFIDSVDYPFDDSLGLLVTSYPYAIDNYSLDTHYIFPYHSFLDSEANVMVIPKDVPVDRYVSIVYEVVVTSNDSYYEDIYLDDLFVLEVISPVYSEDCPYYYKMYYKMHHSGNEQLWLSIFKSNNIILDSRFRDLYNVFATYDIDNPDVVSLAEDKLMEYVNPCLKIATDCCILVCCEPDKYKLIT